MSAATGPAVSNESADAPTGAQVRAPSDPRPSRWHLLISIIIVLAGLALVIWVVVRNEPFKDSISPQIIRVLIGLIAGWGAYSLPGHLGLEMSAQNQKITASSALAVFAITYLGTPVVVPPLSEQNVVQPPPKVIPTRVWAASEYRQSIPDSLIPDTSQISWLRSFLAQEDRSIPLKAGSIEGVEIPPQYLRRGLENPHRDKTMVIESYEFPTPFEAFNAIVSTVPARDRRLGHSVFAFLIRGNDTRKTFIPLVVHSLFLQSEQRPVISVPASQAGDFLLIVLRLDPENDSDGEPRKFYSGKNFPFQLQRL